MNDEPTVSSQPEQQSTHPSHSHPEHHIQPINTAHVQPLAETLQPHQSLASESTPPVRTGSMKAVWISLIIFVAVVGLVIWGVSTLIGMRGGNDRDIVKNGIATEGISSASFYKGPQRVGRSVITVYKAHYRYEVKGESYNVIGEKNYKASENIHKGMRATVYYMSDNPEDATVINEE